MFTDCPEIVAHQKAGDPTAAACGNKCGVLFPVTSLWTLYNFPRARVMYVSAIFDQVRNQFFSGVKRFASHRLFAGWSFLDTEIRTPAGGMLWGRSTAEGGHVEGIHNDGDSPAALLVDECKSVSDEVSMHCHGVPQPSVCSPPRPGQPSASSIAS